VHATDFFGGTERELVYITCQQPGKSFVAFANDIVTTRDNTDDFNGPTIVTGAAHSIFLPDNREIISGDIDIASKTTIKVSDKDGTRMSASDEFDLRIVRSLFHLKGDTQLTQNVKKMFAPFPALPCTYIWHLQDICKTDSLTLTYPGNLAFTFRDDDSKLRPAIPTFSCQTHTNAKVDIQSRHTIVNMGVNDMYGLFVPLVVRSLKDPVKCNIVVGKDVEVPTMERHIFAPRLGPVPMFNHRASMLDGGASVFIVHLAWNNSKFKVSQATSRTVFASTYINHKTKGYRPATAEEAFDAAIKHGDKPDHKTLVVEETGAHANFCNTQTFFNCGTVRTEGVEGETRVFGDSIRVFSRNKWAPVFDPNALTAAGMVFNSTTTNSFVLETGVAIMSPPEAIKSSGFDVDRAIDTVLSDFSSAGSVREINRLFRVAVSALQRNNSDPGILDTIAALREDHIATLMKTKGVSSFAAYPTPTILVQIPAKEDFAVPNHARHILGKDGDLFTEIPVGTQGYATIPECRVYGLYTSRQAAEDRAKALNKHAPTQNLKETIRVPFDASTAGFTHEVVFPTRAQSELLEVACRANGVDGLLSVVQPPNELNLTSMKGFGIGSMGLVANGTGANTLPLVPFTGQEAIPELRRFCTPRQFMTEHHRKEFDRYTISYPSTESNEGRPVYPVYHGTAARFANGACQYASAVFAPFEGSDGQLKQYVTQTRLTYPDQDLEVQYFSDNSERVIWFDKYQPCGCAMCRCVRMRHVCIE
jgi:hypothetical protein